MDLRSWEVKKENGQKESVLKVSGVWKGKVQVLVMEK